MARQVLTGLLAFTVLASVARAGMIVILPDGTDSVDQVQAVIENDKVKQAHKELDKFVQPLLKEEQAGIEMVLGKPTPWPVKGVYAMPVAQPRVLCISGRRYAEEKLNKDHKEFYRVGDIGGLEVWYGVNGTSPQVIIVHLKVDKAFPRLTDKNLEERLAWDHSRMALLAKAIQELKAKK